MPFGSALRLFSRFSEEQDLVANVATLSLWSVPLNPDDIHALEQGGYPPQGLGPLIASYSGDTFVTGANSHDLNDATGGGADASFWIHVPTSGIASHVAFTGETTADR